MALFDLSSKLILITGGSGLLGLKHAEACLEFGATVILADIDTQSLSRAEQKLKPSFSTGKILSLNLDVTSPTAIESASKEILKIFGKYPDVLINNAAIDPKFDRSQQSSGLAREPSRLEWYNHGQWDIELGVGLKGSFMMIQTFGFEMAKRGNGNIINIASDLGVIAPNQSLYRKPELQDHMQPVKPVTYSVVKHGLIGLTKYVATYWAKSGVRCNALVPGGVYNNHADQFVNRISELIPMGRMAHIDEYKGAIVYLASDASTYMNGTSFVIDGGRTIW